MLAQMLRHLTTSNPKMHAHALLTKLNVKVGLQEFGRKSRAARIWAERE